MAKTRSNSDDTDTEQLPASAPMEPTSTEIIISLHELTQCMANSEQKHSQMLSQMSSMMDELRLIKSNQTPPAPIPPVHQLPPHSISHSHMPPPSNFTHQHAPRSAENNAFHARSQFEPQHSSDQAHFQEHARRSDIPYFHDNQRREDAWSTQDNIPKWHVPRVELPKFDGSGVVDWVKDCEYFFDITHTQENSKVQLIIPYLVGEARE
jgi:hypothetical protein